MRTYRWWRSRKKRIRKKYCLMLGMYMSPKELRGWYKDRLRFEKAWKGERELHGKEEG